MQREGELKQQRTATARQPCSAFRHLNNETARRQLKGLKPRSANPLANTACIAGSACCNTVLPGVAAAAGRGLSHPTTTPCRHASAKANNPKLSKSLLALEAGGGWW
eukprot:GHRQ01022697.1.p1 GENE.GHRQ01022697.1~~GHRQ01022697.1.p1  ORF type:complete len:107 (+),score=12.11 GHRQ01022697.1:102-422(+)